MSKITQAFPNLLTETKPEHPGPFPLSFLRQVADEWCTKDGEDQSTLYNAFEEIGLPSFLWAHPYNDVYDWETSIVLNMTDEEYAKYYTRYREQGVCFPYMCHRVEINGTAYYTGWINPDGVRYDDLKDITLFPADLVDVNA